MIYTRMYKEASQYWASKEIFSHGIGIYAHDEESLNNFFVNGFGMRCVDALTSVRRNPLRFDSIADITFESMDIDFYEMNYDQIEDIYKLRKKLIKHLNQSPVFFPVKSADLKTFIEVRKKRNSRFFVVTEKARIIGFIEVTDKAENFASNHREVLNICGAYIEEEYRGTGIFTKLLAYLFERLRDSKVISCGVDCESINPEAYGFWTKHFTPYTYSLVRRIDERSKVEEYELKTQP